MPDITNNQSDASNTNTNEAPKVKRTRKPKRYTVSQMAVARAKARGIDTSRAAKDVRGRLRANFDKVCKLDPSIRKAKDAANDGNRWPAMNEKVYQFVLSSKANKSNK
jgi:hypothetical protein